MGRKKTGPVLIENVLIGAMVAEGKCIAKVNDKAIFVEGLVPGDIATLRITKDKKTFAEAVCHILEKPSDLRIQPFCQHFGTCGGCKWQNLDYHQQLQYKQQQVVDALQRIAKVDVPTVLPIMPSEKTQFYRNKLEYTFSKKRWLTTAEISQDNPLDRRALGFHIPKMFDKILDIKTCYLQPEPSNSIRLAVKAYAIAHDLEFNDLYAIDGFLRNLIIRTSETTPQVMVILQVYKYQTQLLELLDHLQANFPQITSLNYVINSKGNETFHDLDVVTHHGLPYLEELMEGLTFRIGPKSFYQTNSLQAYTLYKIARSMANIQPSDVVYDLYTGTGTIANFVAKAAKKVVGLEYVEMAVIDAKANSQLNGITNTTFFAGDMKDLLTKQFISENGTPDCIITDPPRAGMHQDVVLRLNDSGASRIVYISCNPATQARDLALLDTHYSVSAVQPVDMFPHTHHVENVVLLHKRSTPKPTPLTTIDPSSNALNQEGY